MVIDQGIAKTDLDRDRARDPGGIRKAVSMAAAS